MAPDVKSLGLFGLLSLIVLVQAQTCSPGSPCTIGCCSNDGGFCGYGPDFCAASKCVASLSANGTCSQLSECDPGFNPGWGASWGSTYAGSKLCPLNVCCSKFGFCGTTPEFCGTSTVTQPSCSTSNSAQQRTLGYYEGWAPTRPCDAMTPEEIPIGAYTHLIYGFVSIDPSTFAVVAEAPEEQQLMSRFTALKTLKPGLQTWMSIGGWSFNDPGPTADTFSTLVGSPSAQSAFFSSLSSFMSQYGFDGVDIDWEYPTTPDRNGRPVDFTNFPTFMANLRTHLNSQGKGLSMTLPSSYWYMRGFDIVSLEQSLDWFNVMTYDLHGTWDAIDPFIGNIMLAHTNLTEIRETMDLLWRNNISPSKVNLGIGFYGRSFTATNPNCVQAGCPFSGGGFAGQCTQDVGTLSYTEIQRVIASDNPNILFDQQAAVKIVTWDDGQWVSYDDAQTLALKVQYANSECLGGTMVWAVSLDMDGSAAAALTGQSGTGSLFPGSDGSTGNAGDVFVPPGIWSNPAGSPVKCQPPCTLILPPSSIPATVVHWPPITTEIIQSGGGTSTTVINIPPFTISSLSFWPVTIASGNTAATFSPVQSILPPTPIVIGLPGSETLAPTSSGLYTIIGSPVPTPGDAQPGTVSGCTQWYRTQSGDGCSSIASMFGISVTDFTHWNPVVGSDCSNLWLDQDYCVGGPSGAVPTPTSIIGGNPSDCTQWYQAQSGDSCNSITQKFKLSNSDFYNMNQAVGPNCANGILLGFNYCVSTSHQGVVIGGVQTPVFGSNSHSVTIQPMPTFSVTGISPPHGITWQVGPPNGVTPTAPFVPGATGANGQEPPGCTGCGSTGCHLFGCGGHCGIFGCDGGCGLGFCGGGCGLVGCGPGCGAGACVIAGGGGGTLPPIIPPPPGGEDENCAEPTEEAVECVETVWEAATSTDINCETTTACTATSTTSTTTVPAACTPAPPNLGIDAPGYGWEPLADETNDGWADPIDTVTATVATLIVTITIDPGDPAFSAFGATATFDLGTDAFNSVASPTTTPNNPPPSSTPVGTSCPLGFPNPNDCTSLIFADANLPSGSRLTPPTACYTGNTNGAQWEWCDFATQATCQISIAWRNDQGGNPFISSNGGKGWPTGGEFNAHVGDIWAKAEGCFSGMEAFVDTDVGLGTYYICVKQFGFNCWVSV